MYYCVYILYFIKFKSVFQSVYYVNRKYASCINMDKIILYIFSNIFVKATSIIDLRNDLNFYKN